MHPYLADEDEREEAATYFLSQFGENTSKTLKLMVGPLKVPSFADQVDEYVKFKLNVQSATIEKKGYIFKKPVMTYLLKPQNINYENMLNVANVFYDLILAFDVKVNFEENNI
jgi:hypothetical protein